MADKEETGKTSDEEAQDTKTSEGGEDQEGPSKKKLEESTTPELIAYVKELRTESKTRREENAKLKEALEEVPGLKEKLQELEAKTKSEDELKAERLKELENAAGKLPELEKYEKHVKALYGARMAALKALDETVQEPINSLLEDMPKDDFLGRLKVIDAVLAVSGGKKMEMPKDEVGNPAETGDGESGKTFAKDISWSQQGSQEAEWARLTKSSE